MRTRVSAGVVGLAWMPSNVLTVTLPNERRGQDRESAQCTESADEKICQGDVRWKRGKKKKIKYPTVQLEGGGEEKPKLQKNKTKKKKKKKEKR